LHMRTLVAWIGSADLRGPLSVDGSDVGPIANALDARSYDRVALLANQDADEVKRFVKWLRSRSPAKIEAEQVELTSPTSFGEIYEAAARKLSAIEVESRGSVSLTLHLSPGTPAMAAVWILLGKTRYPAEFIESSKKAGVKTVHIPFDIAAELVPSLYESADRKLIAQSDERPSGEARFGDILYRGAQMGRLITKARKAALRTLPVLIEGESGTGKELLAKAIANEGVRSDKPFRVINCGAIPSELVESELFGHEKGSFSGAVKERIGYFEEADTGTLFLDEIGELPLQAQVKLLRVLQESEVTRVGSAKPRKVDVRIIAATNRDLAEEVAQGRFREDLFYRLAVVVLKIPPLRQREGDIGLLIDALLKRVNEECAEEPGYIHKKLSAGARNLLLNHTWPGNVRELQNTLRRAAVWSDGAIITERDIRDALLPKARRENGVPRDELVLGNGIDLPKVIAATAKRHLEEALRVSNGNKRKAAELLGLPSYQTLSNWAKKYDVRA
jgi:transcriptional regulator with PAS, ATPase and Fis domain